jgi:hypothetical protein
MTKKAMREKARDRVGWEYSRNPDHRRGMKKTLQTDEETSRNAA